MLRFNLTWVWVALVACGAMMAGCGRDDTQAQQDQRTLIIGFIGKSESNDVFQAAHQGARDAARRLEQEHGIRIDLRIETPSREDAQAQARAIRQLTSIGAHGIAVACSDANTLTPAINDAVAAGVPVMCFDSDAPNSRRFVYYGTDDIDMGQKLMRELAEVMGGQGNVAILSGSAAAPNLANRVRGVEQELARHPQMRLVDTVYLTVETAEDARRRVNTAQSANPSIQGWVFVGGWPLFTTNALDWAPGTVKVVSADALPPQLSYLQSGHVQALYAQNCYGWGEQSLEILVRRALTGESPAEERVIDPLTRVTAENLEEYRAQWNQWMGR